MHGGLLCCVFYFASCTEPWKGTSPPRSLQGIQLLEVDAPGPGRLAILLKVDHDQAGEITVEVADADVGYRRAVIYPGQTDNYFGVTRRS